MDLCTAPAPPPAFRPALLRAALALALPAAPTIEALAQEAPLAAEAAGPALPDWVPAPMILPPEAEVARSSEIGSTMRLLVVEIPGDQRRLLDDWREALAEAGYAVERQSEALEDAPVVFSGDGIRTGQIVLLPGTSAEITVIQIDATMGP